MDLVLLVFCHTGMRKERAKNTELTANHGGKVIHTSAVLTKKRVLGP